MNSNQNLTYNRPSAHLHPTCNHGRTFSSTSTPPSSSQPLGDTDLFATLLFDRQRAYQRPSSTLLTSRSSSKSKVRDATPAKQNLKPKHAFQDTIMPPRTRSMSEKQQRQAKRKRVKKPLSAEPDTKLGESKIAKSSERARQTTAREATDVTIISSDEDEVQEIQQLRDELRAAKTRIKQLEDLLETRETASSNPSIEQDDSQKASEELSALEPQLQNPTRAKEEDKTWTKEEVSSKEATLILEVPPPLTPQSPPSSMLPPVSAYPSTVLTKEDIKLENVRTTYTKVKRKLDTLNAIVRKLDWCTKSMDLSHFGEFGLHMKRLREWLEGEQQQQHHHQQQC